jgi:hypothetical protein
MFASLIAIYAFISTIVSLVDTEYILYSIVVAWIIGFTYYLGMVYEIFKEIKPY